MLFLTLKVFFLSKFVTVVFEKLTYTHMYVQLALFVAKSLAP